MIAEPCFWQDNECDWIEAIYDGPCDCPNCERIPEEFRLAKLVIRAEDGHLYEYLRYLHVPHQRIRFSPEGD